MNIPSVYRQARAAKSAARRDMRGAIVRIEAATARIAELNMTGEF